MMNFTTTSAVYDKHGRLKELVGFFDPRPVALSKKGREIVDQAGKQSVGDAKKASGFADENDAFRKQARSSGDAFANMLTPNANGALSPYAKAGYNQNIRQNAAGADNLRQQGFASIARRGFGSAPMGVGSSIINSADRAQMGADTDAYTTAMNNTLGGGLEAMKYHEAQQNMYDPANEIQAATGANKAATDAGVQRSKMGSTFGDIMSGAGKIAGIATGFMNPASALTKGLGAFSKATA